MLVLEGPLAILDKRNGRGRMAKELDINGG
jgi:hypothetical protein